MLLEALLWDCFVSSAQLSDSGLSAAVRCDAPDATLALHLDTTPFRKALSVDKPLCDGLFIGFARAEGQEARLHFLFVELKGRNLPHAVEQLANAIALLREHLQRTLTELTFGRTKFSAVIVSDRAAPRLAVEREAVQRFRRDFKSSLYVRHASRNGPPADLTKDLWHRPG
jgi:hypothetical protein